MAEIRGCFLPAAVHKLRVTRIFSGAHLMLMRRLTAVSVLTGLSMIQLWAQSTAKVSITAIPPWGQDGQITGFVSGVNASEVGLWVFEFVPDIGWWPVPSCSSIPIQSDGSFSANVTPQIIDRAATRFSAYLVPLSLGIPCGSQESANIPFIVE